MRKRVWDLRSGGRRRERRWEVCWVGEEGVGVRVGLRGGWVGEYLGERVEDPEEEEGEKEGER